MIFHGKIFIYLLSKLHFQLLFGLAALRIYHSILLQDSKYMINNDHIFTYLCQIDLTYDLNTDEIFWLDHTLIRPDDVIVGFSRLDLKHYVILGFIVYIYLTRTLSIFLSFPENYCIRGVQVNHFFPVNHTLSIKATTDSTTLLQIHYDFVNILIKQTSNY